ncbi:hypothetical protein BDEG_27426 [Batrachochytrium dendrobatidis JEL423]|uniref:Uncharacterized protein n=1 Tax=Batrachochytrium dendrobatidis (strain JEL423) TaxID=403673 RepID=A0A177WXP3_BATDL|nr:hypothetical protein BDEG_27426 [Batrachochytrium dendrobatidis JEL423]
MQKKSSELDRAFLESIPAISAGDAGRVELIPRLCNDSSKSHSHQEVFEGNVNPGFNHTQYKKEKVVQFVFKGPFDSEHLEDYFSRIVSKSLVKKYFLKISKKHARRALVKVSPLESVKILALIMILILILNKILMLNNKVPDAEQQGPDAEQQGPDAEQDPDADAEPRKLRVCNHHQQYHLYLVPSDIQFLPDLSWSA